ncbi:(d)CMP kinase [Salinispora arenicola]|uniref:(d)CMP kinase n=1 Tax=Salinispora arenicola TaxID=168697 RepID=UPI001E3297E4|nr:(d)CMP kinase [Salinispora arenicola]
MDGPSAAGDSTFAEVLATRLDASAVHVDDFYRNMPHEQRWALILQRHFSCLCW